MKKKTIRTKKNLIFLVCFLIGLFIALYPYISSFWNNYRARLLVTSYDEKLTTNTQDSASADMIEKAQEYNQTLNVPSVPDAFSIRDGIADPVYEDLLNPNGDGMIGYVDIPVIDTRLPIFHYTTDDSLQKGAGHLLGSALPVGGEGTHCVISAHRGLPNAKMFTDLNLMKMGDHFFFHVLDEVFAYEVDGIDIVKPQEVQSLSAAAGKDLATLVTCTPYAVNTHRLLVHGHRVPYSEEVLKGEQSEKPRSNIHVLLLQLAAAATGLLIAFAVILIIHRLQRRRDRSGERRTGGWE